MSALPNQLYDVVRYEGPGDGANHVSGAPQLVDLSKGSPKRVRTVVLDHRQRGAYCFEVVRMEHC
jgi:hypothetical protein